eukprot:2060032-Pyramimonas_sp.AAC.1
MHRGGRFLATPLGKRYTTRRVFYVLVGRAPPGRAYTSAYAKVSSYIELRSSCISKGKSRPV